MKVLVSGSSGLIGSKLVTELTRAGYEAVRLVRSREKARSNAVYWNPAKNEIDREGLERLDAVVHLAGENIAKGRWTDGLKRRIRDSRVKGTRLLCETLAGADSPPHTFVLGAATGIYGNRGDELVHEDSPPGEGFLAEVCREWEAAVEPIEKKMRVVKIRTGMVLSSRGGALARMLPPFKLGLGGKLGSGQQYMSWITLDDLVQIIEFALNNRAVSGPLNAVAPQPVTNSRFTGIVGKVLRRPTIFFVPAFVLKLILGEMAEEMLLSSLRAHPSQLEKHGFEFTHPDLTTALTDLLSRKTHND